MPQAAPEAASRSNYQSIFDRALEAYQRNTGEDLSKDPLLRTLETCDSPDAVLSILRAQIVGPGKSHSSSDKLTTWLVPAVRVINVFSETIGEVLALVSLTKVEVIGLRSASDLFLKAYPPAGVIFTGIGVLLSVSLYILHHHFPGYCDVLVS